MKPQYEDEKCICYEVIPFKNFLIRKFLFRPVAMYCQETQVIVMLVPPAMVPRMTEDCSPPEYSDVALIQFIVYRRCSFKFCSEGLLDLLETLQNFPP